jgi:hypothetical protein
VNFRRSFALSGDESGDIGSSGVVFTYSSGGDMSAGDMSESRSSSCSAERRELLDVEPMLVGGHL